MTEELALETIMEDIHEVLGSITHDAVMERVRQNMTDEFDHPDEKDITRAVAEVLVDRLRQQGILPQPTVPPGFYAPPF